jgi:hypothetical protein
VYLANLVKMANLVSQGSQERLVNRENRRIFDDNFLEIHFALFGRFQIAM